MYKNILFKLNDTIYIILYKTLISEHFNFFLDSTQLIMKRNGMHFKEVSINVFIFLFYFLTFNELNKRPSAAVFIHKC